MKQISGYVMGRIGARRWMPLLVLAGLFVPRTEVRAQVQPEAQALAKIRAQRSVPDDNLAYPVLVKFPDELASGFYLNTATSVYLVTAKHVILDSKGNLRGGPVTLLSYSRDPKEAGRNLLQLDLASLLQAGDIKWHDTADVAVIRVAELTVTAPDPGHPGMRAVHPIAGVSVQSFVANGILGVGMDSIKKYGDVLVANDVLLFGYPTSLGIQVLPQLDPLRPLLRSGIVAGLNPTTRTVIVDCPSYPGNSGGPVVEVDRSTFESSFEVIGVVSQFVPFAETSITYPIGYTNTNISNSGYTIVTPMDFVLQLVQ